MLDSGSLSGADSGRGMPESPAPHSPGSKSRRPAIAVALIGLLLALVAVGGWLIVGRGDDDASSASPALDRLPNEPVELYSVTVDSDTRTFSRVVGTPERIAVGAAMSSGDELRVLDGAGTELWSRDIYLDVQFEMIDGDVILASRGNDDRDGQLLRLDGANGYELWTTEVDSFDSIEVYPGSLLLYGPSKTGRKVVGYDTTTGDRLGEYSTISGLQTGPTLSTTDGVSVIANNESLVDDEWLVVDERLNEISRTFSWTAMDEPDAWAYMDGEILAATGQELILYSDDGKKLAADDLDLPAEISWVNGAGDSVWLYSTGNVCGAVRIAGYEVERLWQSSQVCESIDVATVVRYLDGDPLLFSHYPEETVINALTGERMHVAENAMIFPYSNGFVVRDSDDVTAYGWPGDQVLFSAPRGKGQFAGAIDGGYVTLDVSDDRATITVYAESTL